MICPYCGYYRKANAATVGRAMRSKISALCGQCGERYMVDADNVLEGDKQTEDKVCRVCGVNTAAPGMKICYECNADAYDKKRLKKKKANLEKERSERRKPQKSIDELNAEAAALHMSYGKYVSMLYMKRLKGEE